MARKRAAQVHVYLFEEEKQLLEVAARRVGQALAPWLRGLGLLEAREQEEARARYEARPSPATKEKT